MEQGVLPFATRPEVVLAEEAALRDGWWLLNTSGGKDSQTMIRVAVRRAEEVGVPRERLLAVHADLGDVEWPGTKELAERQARHYGLRFEIVRREETLLDGVRRRGMWPSPRARYCTSDWKRAPVQKLMTRVARESGDRPATIINCLGLRAEESPGRARRAPWSLDERASNGRRQVWTWLPIHGWSESQVWASIRASGVAFHGAYRHVGRLSCALCIFAPRAALIAAGRENRELLEEYVRVEAETGHRFRMDVSLAEVLAAVEAGEAAERVDSWAM